MAKGGKAEKWAARSERLSAALRENLKRRKEQARGRRRTMEGESDQEISKQTEANSPPPDAEAGASPEFRRNRVRE
jgi:hypothetical protein